MTSQVFKSLSWTVFSLGETEMASVLVRTAIPKFPRKTASFATSRLASFGITPETWYGSPQFAYET